MKRYCVQYVTGWIGGYCDYAPSYAYEFFDTMEEAEVFCNGKTAWIHDLAVIPF